MVPNAPDAAECPHFQPADLVALAEKHLREAGVPESAWEGRRFHWGGPIDSPPFTGLVMECKRKNGDWALTRLDRRKQGVTEEETGFREIV
jgi:hypothetical protein